MSISTKGRNREHTWPGNALRTVKRASERTEKNMKAVACYIIKPSEWIKIISGDEKAMSGKMQKWLRLDVKKKKKNLDFFLSGRHFGRARYRLVRLVFAPIRVHISLLSFTLDITPKAPLLCANCVLTTFF